MSCSPIALVRSLLFSFQLFSPHLTPSFFSLFFSPTPYSPPLISPRLSHLLAPSLSSLHFSPPPYSPPLISPRLSHLLAPSLSSLHFSPPPYSPPLISPRLSHLLTPYLICPLTSSPLCFSILQSLRPGDVCDAQDDRAIRSWKEAVVTHTATNGDVTVHYRGWSSTYDEVSTSPINILYHTMQ